MDQYNFNANRAGLPIYGGFSPTFLNSQLGIPQGQTFNPAPIAVGTGMEAIYNQNYNNQLADYQRSESLARQQAQQGQQNLANQFNVTAGIAEQQRQGGINSARQSYQDTILQNRARARALGAGSSSGYLDLGSRADRTLSNNINSVNLGASQSVNQAAMSAQQALQEIENNLNKSIAEIESNRRLSLRQKDEAIMNARLQAATSASTDIDWDALLGNFETDNSTSVSNTSVLGAGLPSGAIGSQTGGGYLYGNVTTPSKGNVMGMSTTQAPNSKNDMLFLNKRSLVPTNSFVYGGSSRR